MKFLSVYISSFDFLITWELSAHHSSSARRNQLPDLFSFSESPVSPGPCSELSEWGLGWAGGDVGFLQDSFRLPDWALLGDVFFTIVFSAGSGGIRVIGEMLSNEDAVGLVEGPGLSMGVDVFWSSIFLLVAAGAVKGPGASVSWVASNWAPVIFCGLSAKQNFSIFRLFLLYSPKDFQATKFINRSLASKGLGLVSLAIAKLLLRMTIFVSILNTHC